MAEKGKPVGAVSQYVVCKDGEDGFGMYQSWGEVNGSLLALVQFLALADWQMSFNHRNAALSL